MPQCLAADSGRPWMTVLCLSVPARAEGRPGTSLRHKDDKNFTAPCFAEALMWVLLWKYVLALLGWESPVLTPIPSYRCARWSSVCLCKCRFSQLWNTRLPVRQALGLGSNKAVPPFCKELLRVVRLLFFRIEAQPSPSAVLIEYFASWKNQTFWFLVWPDYSHLHDSRLCSVGISERWAISPATPRAAAH